MMYLMTSSYFNKTKNTRFKQLAVGLLFISLLFTGVVLSMSHANAATKPVDKATKQKIEPTKNSNAKTTTAPNKKPINQKTSVKDQPKKTQKQQSSKPNQVDEQTFKPSVSISEDLSVSFPVGI